MNKRGLSFVLALLLLSGTAFPVHCANPAGESVYCASENSDGSQSTLYQLHRADTFSTPVSLAVVTGRSAQLVVCEGLAYWAVDESGQTKLYRSRLTPPGIDTLATIPSAATRQLKTDGHVVYWTYDTATSTVLNYVHNRLNQVLQAKVFNTALSKALEVENGRAAWGIEGGDPLHPTVIVTQYLGSAANSLSYSAQSQSIANSKINGMELEEGNLWLLTTTQGSAPTAQFWLTRWSNSTQFQAISTVNGTGQQLATKRGWAFFTVRDNTADNLKLFRSSTFIPFVGPMATLPGCSSASLCLMEDEGLLAANVGTDISFQRFQVAEGPAVQISTLANLQAVGASSCKDSAFVTTQSSPNAYRPVYRVKEGKLPEFMGGLKTGSIYLGHSEAFWFYYDRIVIRGLDDPPSNSYYYSFSVGEQAQVAVGPSATPVHYFSANTTAGGRSFFAYNGNNAAPVSNPGPYSDPAGYFPSSPFSLDNISYFSAPVNGINKLGAIGNSGAPDYLNENKSDPAGFYAFKGYLYYWAKDENIGKSILCRRANGVSSSLFSELIAPTPIPSKSLVGENGGYAYYYGINAANHWVVGRVDGRSNVLSVVREHGSADLPPPDGFVSFRRYLYYSASEADGTRSLIRVDDTDSGNVQAVVSQADSISTPVSFNGYLHFIKTAGGVRKMGQINPFNGLNYLPIELGGPVGAMRATSNFLYFSVQQAEGDSLYRMQIAGTPQLVATTGSIRSMQTFEDNLLLVANDSSGQPRLYHIMSPIGVLLGPATNLSDPQDFISYAGRLVFSARNPSGARGLYAWRNGTIETLPPGVSVDDSFGFNPRSFSIFQDQLLFAGNDSSWGRELWAITFQDSPFLHTLRLADLISGPPGSNPYEDGPRKLQLSTTTIPENLPVGTDVAGLSSAKNDSTSATFSVLFSPAPSGQPGFQINGSRLLTNSAFSYDSTAGHMNLLLRARNSWGIFNDFPFTLTILKNYQAWLDLNFPASPIPSGIADPIADPDQDGITNLMERALGQNPVSANGGQGAPSSTIVVGPSSNYLALQFRVPVAGYSDIKYTVEASTDLIQWSSIASLSIDSSGQRILEGGSPSINRVSMTQPAGQNFINVTVGDTQDLGEGPKRFLRLKVSN